MPLPNRKYELPVWYRLSTAFQLSCDSLVAHKLRSALTLLGVVIGVASVVLVGAAIEGLGVYAETSTAKAFGTQSYLIAQIANVGRLTRTERAAKLRYNRRIRPDDLEYLRETTGDQVLYSPYAFRVEDVKRETPAGEAFLFEGAVILGVSAELAEIRDLAILEGRFFTEQEERTKRPLCVIGQDVRTTLFPDGAALDGIVRIRGFEFRVIGVQEKLGSTGGQSQDNQVYLPASAHARLFGTPQSTSVFARPRPETGLSLDGGLDLTRAALRSRFHTRPGAPDNFDTLTPDSIREFIDRILGLVAAVVVPVTAISLVVGGIVIMNIMLVSVSERTREIGIRKAIGARKEDIRLQFLVESVLLSAIGGLIGLVLGGAAAFLLGLILAVELPVTLPYVVISILVSSVAGIVSGWYPAARAADLDPVAAMRAE